MPNNEKVKSSSFKTITVIDVLFYLSFFTSIVISISMERKLLIYIMPIVIFSIALKYVSVTIKKVKPLFVVALLADLASIVMSVYDFIDYFMWISISTCVYLVCFTLILMTYLNKSKLKLGFSIFLFIGFVLLSYIIYVVLELLVDYIPDKMLFFALLCALCLMIYVIACALVYINDNYRNGIIIFASGALLFIQIFLSPINELFLYHNIFTTLIIICNVLSFYLFMKFISETNAADANDLKENYL